VLQPNYRGSSGYGRAFFERGWGEWGGKMLSDIADGVFALGAQGIADPARACIVGASYGGYAALAGVTLQHGLYRCAVAVGGVSDLSDLSIWTQLRHHRQSSAVRGFLKETGADVADRGALDALSPVKLAGGADAPVLLIHATDDTVVPIEQSQSMASALKHAGKTVELVKLKGDDHWLSREDTRVEMLKAAVGFVTAHNPPDR
jgi:dipeptidyl aminopeptidase/acylaminoacyl peptidase